MDGIFLHVPKKIGNYQEILKMPLGLTALAQLLNDNGIQCLIYHHTIEQLVDGQFTLSKMLAQNKPRFVCLDLHWHPQTYRVLEIAKNIKQIDGAIKVILGGFTATYFAPDIMAAHKEIDFIIKGDAEVPLLQLAQTIMNGSEIYQAIPNLLWRKDGKPKENEQTYIVDQQRLDELQYGNLALINNHEIYDRMYDYEVKLGAVKADGIKKGRSFAYYNAGRGCPVNCSYCGGANLAQCLINKRKEVVSKSYGSVIRDLKQFASYGIKNIYTCYNPYPNNEYYLGLFQEVRKSGLKFNLYFESWGLPSLEFIDEFRQTFGGESRIIISPDTGSELIRRKNKAYYYSNEELFKVLDHIANRQMKAELYFSIGLPFETLENIRETTDLMARIKREYGDRSKLIIMPIELDPASPMWLDNKKYKVISYRKDFKDIYLAHRSTPTLGYRTEELSSSQIINAFKQVRSNLAKIKPPA